MWYHVFLWALFSSFLVHTVAGAIAFCRLRSHKIGRFIPVAILAMGIIWPLTAGAITSMCLLVFCFMHFSFVWCVSCPGSVQRFHFVLVISSFGLAWFSSPSSKPLCICYIQGAAKKTSPTAITQNSIVILQGNFVRLFWRVGCTITAHFIKSVNLYRNGRIWNT